MENPPPIQESTPWTASLLLAIAQALLLLMAALGPQHGDGAIGGAISAGLAALLFAVQLLAVTPWLFARAFKLRYEAEHVMQLKVLWPLLVGPVGLVVVLIANGLRT